MFMLLSQRSKALFFLLKNNPMTFFIILGLFAVTCIFKVCTRLRPVMGVCLVMLVAIFVNPLWYMIADRLNLAYDYYRIYWLFPMTAIVSYLAVKVLVQYHRVHEIFLVLFVLLSISVGYRYELHFVKADNSYHISDETARIAEIIVEDDREDKLAAVPEALTLDIRSYQPSIKLLNGTQNAHQYYEEYTKDEDRLYYELNFSKKPDVKWVGEWIRMYDFVYLVWERGKVTDDELDALLYNKIGETENYVVYAVKHDELERRKEAQ